MYYTRIIQIVVVTLLLSVLAVSSTTETLAQTTANVCTTITRQALTQVGVNCSRGDTGTVCYGFPEIESILLNDAVFSEPGDSISAADVITLRPAAIDLAEETWGVSVLNLQANLPSGFENDVLVIALGGAEIETGVALEDAFTPLDAPVSLTTAAAGEFRTATLTTPSRSEVIGQIPASTTVSADAVSQDGAWVRVIYDGDAGWLSAAALSDDDALSDLPTLNDGQLTALQAFYTRTGIDSGNCAPTSSWVFVQGPRETPVDVVINDAHIRIQSTIAVRTLSAGDPVGTQLQILVLYGFATINPDTPREIIVPAGFILNIGYPNLLVSAGVEGDEDERGAPSSFGIPQVVTQQILDDVDIVRLLPSVLLNYVAFPPIRVTPSGVGAPIVELIFSDPGALSSVRELCEEGDLSPDICRILGLS